MPKMKKYQLIHFCPGDHVVANRLENYLLNVGLNLKIFGQPLGRIISAVQESSIQSNSTAKKEQDPDYDELEYYLRN